MRPLSVTSPLAVDAFVERAVRVIGNVVPTATPVVFTTTCTWTEPPGGSSADAVELSTIGTVPAGLTNASDAIVPAPLAAAVSV